MLYTRKLYEIGLWPAIYMRTKLQKYIAGSTASPTRRGATRHAHFGFLLQRLAVLTRFSKEVKQVSHWLYLLLLI